MPKFRDLTDQTFGRLTAISFVRRAKNSVAVWLWRCECGVEKEILASNVVHGKTVSCTCWLKSNQRKNIRPNRTLLWGESSLKTYFKSYLDGAERRKYEWKLSLTDFFQIIIQDCYLCGDPPQRRLHRKGSHGWLFVNGIDRVDNKIGYILENIKPCCTTCNKAKLKMSFRDFVSHSAKIYEHQKVKNGAE